MSNNTLFITAARKKYRFDSSKGQINAEDLFDCNLWALDSIAVALDDKIQKAGRKSFVGKKLSSTGDDENKLEIVKFVIETKQAEEDARKVRAEKQTQKEFLTKLLQQKKMEQLESLSAEDIQKQLDSLE